MQVHKTRDLRYKSFTNSQHKNAPEEVIEDSGITLASKIAQTCTTGDMIRMQRKKIIINYCWRSFNFVQILLSRAKL